MINEIAGIEIGDPDQREARAAAIAEQFIVPDYVLPILEEEEKKEEQIDQVPPEGEFGENDSDNTIESDIPNEEDYTFGNE